jgi:hypothetical protein
MIRPLFCILILTAAMAGLSRANDPIRREFLLDTAHSAMATARSPDEFKNVARAYQAVIDNGAANGPVFYHLGTALLLAGQPADATRALLRAERYMGTTWAIERNLRGAQARQDQDKAGQLPWYRIPLFWHFALGFHTRAWLTVTAFLGIWVALSIRRLGFVRTARPLWLLSLTVFALFASSVLTSLHQESGEQPPLCLLKADTTGGPP